MALPEGKTLTAWGKSYLSIKKRLIQTGLKDHAYMEFRTSL